MSNSTNPITYTHSSVREADPALNGGKLEVVFVDTGIANYQTLEADVGAGIGIVEIDHSQSGLAQLKAWAQSHSGYDSISVLSHGGAAQVTLGSDVLSAASLSSASVKADLGVIGAALKADGDFLLYGCDVASGAAGLQFVADLAAATAADVEAASHPVGASGGWVLDAATGAVTATPFAAPDFVGDLFANTINYGNVATGQTGTRTPGSSYSNATDPWQT